MVRGRNPLINCTVHGGVITLHIVSTAETRAVAESQIERDEAALRELLGDYIYGEQDETLSEVVGRKLSAQGKTLAIAESCTGGLAAKMITDVPGASEYFRCGWVVYSNEAKIRELGVDADLIERYGAVSAEVADALAVGVCRKGGSDFGIGITGIAGPGGGSEQKPVGLVYIGVNSGNKSRVERYFFSHTREHIRRRAALTSLNMLRKELKN